MVIRWSVQLRTLLQTHTTRAPFEKTSKLAATWAARASRHAQPEVASHLTSARNKVGLLL